MSHTTEEITMRSAKSRPLVFRSSLGVLALAFFAAITAGAQQSAQPSKFTGCVQAGSGDSIILSAPNVCAVLKGKISAEQVTGHQIELKGVLTPSNKSGPATIQVESVSSVGQSCTETCAARPRGRGLHPPPKEVPGSEGGTPGAPVQ
jgi:hypothetical protein